MTRLRGDVFAGKLPAIGDSRGQAKPRFVAVKHVHVAFFFQFLHPGQAFGFVGVIVRVLRLFQGVAEAPPGSTALVKKRRNVLANRYFANSWRNVAATSLSCGRAGQATGLPAVKPGVDRRTTHLQHGHYRRDGVTIRT